MSALSHLSTRPDHQPLRFEEWLPLRGRWLWLFVSGIQAMGLLFLLGCLVAPRYTDCGCKGQRGSAKAQIGSFKTAVELYRVDHDGECPRRLQDLIYRPADEIGSTCWKGPYLQDLTFVPPDPWGHPYRYQVPGSNGAAYEIRSLGKDGYPGGAEEAEDLSSILK